MSLRLLGGMEPLRGQRLHFWKPLKILKDEATASKHVKFFKTHSHVKLVLKNETGQYRKTM